MLGEGGKPGLIGITVGRILQAVEEEKEREYKLLLTYVEIYNEMIRDLLMPKSNYLELRDDPNKVFSFPQFVISYREL